MTVRVLIVDDHPVVRAGLIGMLGGEDGLEIVGEAASGDEAVVQTRRLEPDVVLLDLRMPGSDGVTATRQIVADTTSRVLILTTYDTDSDILRAVQAGATGYLLKDTPSRQLADSIRAAARGETVLAPPVAARLVSRMREPQHERLTPREVEVLAAVAKGLSNSDVGLALSIGESTVKTHLLRIFSKLDVDDRTAAVTVALRRGILDGP